MRVLGWDVGGANTKAALVEAEDGSVRSVKVDVKYFPFWKNSQTDFFGLLRDTAKTLVGKENVECIGLTMTAELSDCYRTKREGVNRILDCFEQAFAGMPVFVLDVEGKLQPIASARTEPLKTAAANWAATGWLVSQLISDCVVVDVGSTSTSIIPVRCGKVAANGKTDLEKLMTGELVYTGGLRTNVACTVQTVPLRGSLVPVSSEFFAQSADVHLILGNLKKTNYTVDTPDGKGTSRGDALARLARIVCADMDMLDEEEIYNIAAYAWHKQVQQIAEGLEKVYHAIGADAKNTFPAVVAGFAKNFLARLAAKKAGVAKVVDLAKLTGRDFDFASPAVALALMTLNHWAGKDFKWTQL